MMEWLLRQVSVDLLSTPPHVRVNSPLGSPNDYDCSNGDLCCRSRTVDLEVGNVYVYAYICICEYMCVFVHMYMHMY